MKIAFNPSTVAALTTPPNNKDITFDLRGRNIFARGVKFYGTDTNTWRDIKVNNVSIGSHTLDLRNGSNTTLTNTNGVVTINSTWRPVVDNLTSNSTTSSLSANQGRVLKALIDGKSDSGHNHDGRYVRYYAVTTLDCNNLAAGLTAARVSATNAAHTNNSVYLYISDIGTPFQIQIPDSNVPYIYKRYYSSGKWSGWFKLNAGYADSAGSVAWANITGKPSSYTPSAHTHAWNSLTHSSTTENQAILTNGKANGWKLYTLNISGWNNAANNAHSHANKSVLDGITSGLVNNWNTAYTFVHTITGTDTDKVINKWDEIVNFLAGITEDNKLNTLLNSKLSVYELADKTNVGTIKNNGIYYSTTEASTGTLTNSPFTNAFALINMTNLNNNEDQLRRCRLAFSRVGDIKVSDDHLDDGTAETWYNVLTSKNSGIDGSTIKLNGTSITVYSSGTADGRYVKKSGDTMTGVLTIDTTNFGTLTIKRNNDADGASIQFRGKSSVYGYIGFNAANRNKQLLRWNDAGSQVYTILDTSSTYTSGGKGVINGTTITQVDNADKLDGYHANTSQSPFGRVPTIGGDGVMEIGKYIDFHYDNEGKYDYSTRLQATGNHQNTLLLPSGTGTLALTSQIPNKNSWNYDDRYLKLTGGAMVGTINRRSGGSTISGRDHAIIRQTYAPGGSSWNPIACVDTETGTWTLGHLSSGSSNTDFSFCFSTNADYNAGNNAGNYVTLRNRIGTIALTSEIPSKGSWNYDDRYYTKAESNAKYITDITTSVNKLTFTKNGSSIARTITVNNVQSLGKRSPLTERNAISGIYTYGTYSATDNLAPTNYFETLGFGEGVAGTIEIGGSWISGGKLYWRALRDCCEDWFSWKTILDSSNYSGILDSRYYTESEVNSLLSKKLDRVNLSVGTWNPRGYNLAADYHYNGGDLSISENGGKMYVSIDGQFYQNEGQYRVLDTSDIGSIRGGLTLYQYLSSTDTNWFPLIWGGSDHKNTNNSTGSLYKSYDKLSWQTSSQTLYATNIQTENIKHLSIGGGIYWNPDVESATDGSDAASITLVKSGVAGGTTLVLSQMNDANDTIQFKTSTTAKLYHNSYPILTTQNTYVNNHKGYIYGTEITQVNNSNSSDRTRALRYSGTGSSEITAYQTDSSYMGRSGWASYIICNHGDGSKYYSQTIAMPFWGSPIYRRLEDGTDRGWKKFYTEENPPSWDNVINKPSSFTPSSHTHTWASITDKLVAGNEFNIVNAGFKEGMWFNYLPINDRSKTATISSYHFGNGAKGYTSIIASGFIKSGGNASQLLRADGGVAAFNWSGQSGQPTWLWGGNSQHSYYVYNPSNFRVAYAASAGNADTLDSYHESSFLRYRGATSTDQETTLWSQIGIKQYNNALPDDLTNVYNYGSVISLPGSSSRFEIYAPHGASAGNGLYYRSGWNNDKKPWLKFIDSSNIGSQTVTNAYHLRINSANSWSTWNWAGQSGQPSWLWGSNDGTNMYVWNPSNFRVAYASSAGNADTVDGYHATDGRTFNGNINWSNNWSDAWSDGTNKHPWYGFDHRYQNTGAYSTTITDYFGMTIKTANTLRLDFGTLLLNGVDIHNINVASASKLQTARNIALGTDLRGSANFDGSSNIIINANINACTIGVGSTNGLPFKRIAHFEIGSSWNDNALLLYISQGYINGSNGICRVEFRTDNISSSSTSVTASAAVRWLVRNGYNLDSLYAGYYVTTGKAYIDIYLKTTGGYQGTVIRVLQDSRGGINSNVQLINSYYYSDTNHKEAYNSVEAASTALYNRAYTRIVSGSDVGTVSHANSAGSVNWNNITGKPSSLPANGGNADTVDGVHMDWSTNYTEGNYLAIWDNKGNCIRPIPKGSTSVGYASSAGNASTLGGTSLGGLFTAFGNNAHNITATIGGVTKSFLVNWAADSDKLDGKHASDFATVGHNHDSRYVKIWGNVEANFNFPDGEGHSGVYMCHTTKTQSNKPETYGLLTDFSTVNGHLQFFGASSNKIYTRTYWWTDQDNFKYTDWHTLLHTGNSSVSGHTITINGTSTTWSNSWRPIGTGASDAAAGNHTHKVKINGSEKTITATGVTDLGTYLTSHQSLANYYTKGQVDAKLGKYLPLAGGTMDAGAQIQRTATGGMWYQGRSIALLRETSADGYHALWSLKTTDGSWDFGEYNSSDWNNIPVLSYVLDSNFDKGSNITTYQIKFPLASGTIALTSNILNPTNYYWANVKISASSNSETSPTFNTAYATNYQAMYGSTSVSAAKLESANTLVYGTDTSSQSINTYLRGTNVIMQVKKGTSIKYNALQLTSDRINCNNYCDMKYGAAVSGGNFTVNNNAYLAQSKDAKVGIGINTLGYCKLTVGGNVMADGFHHTSHDNNDAVLLAGGDYFIGGLVKYWAIYSIYIGNTATKVSITKINGNYNFIRLNQWISEGVVTLHTTFPSGYNRDNTLIFGNGDHRDSSSWQTPVYVTLNFKSFTDSIGVMISDDSSLNSGFARIYFMCLG